MQYLWFGIKYCIPSLFSLRWLFMFFLQTHLQKKKILIWEINISLLIHYSTAVLHMRLPLWSGIVNFLTLYFSPQPLWTHCTHCIVGFPYCSVFQLAFMCTWCTSITPWLCKCPCRGANKVLLLLLYWGGFDTLQLSILYLDILARACIATFCFHSNTSSTCKSCLNKWAWSWIWKQQKTSSSVSGEFLFGFERLRTWSNCFRSSCCSKSQSFSPLWLLRDEWKLFTLLISSLLLFIIFTDVKKKEGGRRQVRKEE